MKRKNLKVGLRVVLKPGAYLNLPAGLLGVVDQVEPEEYMGILPCRVVFEGCERPRWTMAEELRIADKVRKTKAIALPPEAV